MLSRPKTASPLETDTATSGEPATGEPPAGEPPPEAAEPLGRAVAAALAFPIGAVALAVVLFVGIKVHEPSAMTLAAATPATLRPIVDQVLQTDLTAERLKDAFGTGPGSSALCTTDPLPPLPVKPAPKIDAAKVLRDRRDACRTLLTARLSASQSVQLLGQIFAETIVERTLSPTFVLDQEAAPEPKASGTPADAATTKGLKDELSTATTKWLNELQHDAFTERVIAGANATVVTKANNTKDARAEGSAADPVEMGIARVLSAQRLEAALKRGLTADLRPRIMGNGVAGWSKDVAGRLTWATMAFIFCAAFVFVMTAAFGQLRHVEEGSAGLWQRNGFLVAAVLAVVVVLVPVALGAIGVNTGPLEEALTFFATRYGLHVGVAINVSNVLAVIGAVFLIVGSVATFMVEVRTADEVKVQLSGLRMLFNAGAIFLLAGTLEVNALLRWPAVFYPDATAQSLIAAANWMATAVGAVFTIVLLAVYLPSVTILHEQVRWLPAAEKADAENVFTAMGFGDGGIQQVSRLLQALAPLLTGLTLTAASTL